MFYSVLWILHFTLLIIPIGDSTSTKKILESRNQKKDVKHSQVIQPINAQFGATELNNNTTYNVIRLSATTTSRTYSHGGLFPELYRLSVLKRKKKTI